MTRIHADTRTPWKQKEENRTEMKGNVSNIQTEEIIKK